MISARGSPCWSRIFRRTASTPTLKRTLFNPNIVFLRVPPLTETARDLLCIMEKATENFKGIILYAPHPQAALGRKRRINLWLTGPCLQWSPGMRLENCDLSILLAYKLVVNWGADLRVIAMVGDREAIAVSEEALRELIEYTRLPVKNIMVRHGGFMEFLGDSPHADIHIFSLPPDPDIGKIREIVNATGSTCVFCRDSTRESALA